MHDSKKKLKKKHSQHPKTNVQPSGFLIQASLRNRIRSIFTTILYTHKTKTIHNWGFSREIHPHQKHLQGPPFCTPCFRGYTFSLVNIERKRFYTHSATACQKKGQKTIVTSTWVLKIDPKEQTDSKTKKIE